MILNQNITTIVKVSGTVSSVHEKFQDQTSIN